jgi:starch phosphorylase
VKALRSFAVRAALPEQLEVLVKLALNLRWSWDTQTVDLFRWVDGEAWERAGHDPMRMLGLVKPDRYEELLGDGPFMAFLASVAEDLDSYLEKPRWYQAHAGDALKAVAYFSPEFGVSEAVPIYSGGLGVLAGDHLKAASDLGVPLIAVGLLYREGYFRQHLNADGWQQERYPALDPHGMPLTLLRSDDGVPVQIEVDLAGITCAAQIWLAQVGRVPLLLLDCDVEANGPDERAVTDRLYGGGSEHRLRQEIVLGIGGYRALQAAGYEANVFHSNEGHAGFMGLERIRQLVAGRGLTFDEALEAVRSGTVFTTHTPVPAGIDVYDADSMDRYFSTFAAECGIEMAELMSLGHSPGEDPDSPFNMAVMGFRLAARSNGVSKLHGQVSRAIFAPLWPAVPGDEIPVGSITNGVHLPTWLSAEMAEVLDRRFPPEWAESGTGRWERVEEIPDAELWRARDRARERLVYFVRQRLRAQLLASGVSESEAAWTDDVFDPGVLTIGFARRFAPYKRGTLLLTDVERLKRLLLSGERPIQVVLAGKAHPHDDPGKELIRQLVHFAADPEVRGRFAFIEDYDMEVGRVLTSGADVWLNNPRRPMEASGTSGMKAALNGVINVSVLDGWWDECFDGQNGWAIGTDDTFADHSYQDRVEASALYDLLERDVVPRFYDRPEGPVPRRWIERMKSSIETLGPFVTADRMVRDYVNELYLPAAAQAEDLSADDLRPARELADWKARLAAAWSEIKVLNVEGVLAPAQLGESRDVSATVRTGDVSTDDIIVQLAHGPVGANGELVGPELGTMEARHCADGTCVYEGTFVATSPGLYGFAVRVLPAHKDLANPMDMGLVAWA